MTILNEHKYSDEAKQYGYFFFNEDDYNSLFKKYAVSVKTMVERAYRAWKNNARAGRGASEQMQRSYFELGEPLLRSEYQVSNIISISN